MTAVVADDAIVEETTIEAPAERIFYALTRPEELLRWWAVEGKFRAVAVECDVRPGGTWWMQVEGDCAGSGAVHTVRGVYGRIEAPRLVEFTWQRDGEEWPESVVRWELEEKDGATRVRVTHSGLTSEAMRARDSGWPLIIKLLEAWMVR
ncbi:MAG: SRPBCC domain-containing protein [Acidobacteriaceae bacterium]